MPTLTEETAIIAKTRELCAALLEDAELQTNLAKVTAFIDDEKSHAQFVELNEAGDTLQRRQQAGELLSPEEIANFKKMQEAAAGNAVITEFFEAQSILQGLHNEISGYIAKTFELRRVPTAEDFPEEGGCGHGCGCH